MKTGKIRDTHEDYPEAMRWLAAKENVPLIDLNEMTRTLYEAMGVEPSKRHSYIILPEPIRDKTGYWQIIPTSILTELIKSPNVSLKG